MGLAAGTLYSRLLRPPAPRQRGRGRRAPRRLSRASEHSSASRSGGRIGSRAVEFIPKALIVGVFGAIAPGVDTDKINRIWMQLSRRMGYRQLIQTGEGGAQFVTSGDDAFLIQPPLLQFR